MGWVLLLGIVLALGIALGATSLRRGELRRMQQRLRAREVDRESVDAASRLHTPIIDLGRCLGCGTCVKACPEGGVLDLVHGQAQVVQGARCVGHATCARECPVGAIQIGIVDVDSRRDLPVLSSDLEAVGMPDVFLAGEVTAQALIKPAVEQGTAVAAQVARRRASGDGAELDLCIVGAGPAGLACALEATRLGLRFAWIERESCAGGTVARYPRRKLVLTAPVELPLHGRLARPQYTREELVELWDALVREHHLELRTGETLQRIERDAGALSVWTDKGVYRARNVCLALGRRGAPRKLGVAGEELAKVSYGLLDARAYRGRRALVVGGGDSAVETALALAEQGSNEVTLSYRRAAFVRIRARNAERLERAVQGGSVRVLYESEVRRIDAACVELGVLPAREAITLPNDDVFVMAGGMAPAATLEACGVSFDPALRPRVEPRVEAPPSIGFAVPLAFALSLFALAWTLHHFDYYSATAEERATQVSHDLLRPGRGAGLVFALAACTLVALNLSYVLRRWWTRMVRFGSLTGWMSLHIVTGVLAFLFAVLHSALAPRDSVGGHALLGLGVLIVTGAVGRYFYAWLPRAANGRELELDEVRRSLDTALAHLPGASPELLRRARATVERAVDGARWRGSFPQRVLAHWRGQRGFERELAEVERDARDSGVADEQIEITRTLARRAHRIAVAAAHLEDLRAVLATWRYLHRWVAVLVVVLIVLHVAYVSIYGSSSLLETGS